MDMKTYKRCEFIIRQFMSVEKPTAELAALFHGWLLDGHHCREKNVVIRRLFNEVLSDLSPAPPIPDDDLSSDDEFLNKFLATQKSN